ncbi:MAG: histidine phosphatase family protein [Bacteroidetes bacterium]|nr:histidine phosphatase family protein [Fibrella sp.]
MNRTLYLIRHAKAEEGTVYQRDHDRALLPEGVMAVARIGRYLHERGITADRLVSSTACRAKDTAKVLAEQLSLSPDEIILDAALYDGGARAYLAAVNTLPADYTSVMLFGHNPDISYFTEFLTHQPVGDMDKGAVAAIRFDDMNWAEVSGRTGHLSFCISPNDLTV